MFGVAHKKNRAFYNELDKAKEGRHYTVVIWLIFYKWKSSLECARRLTKMLACSDILRVDDPDHNGRSMMKALEVKNDDTVGVAVVSISKEYPQQMFSWTCCCCFFLSPTMYVTDTTIVFVCAAAIRSTNDTVSTERRTLARACHQSLPWAGVSFYLCSGKWRRNSNTTCHEREWIPKNVAPC